MQVKIRQLRALEAIVRLGSFVEAARALHVTPAALSLAIRELEDRLGFTVLERTTRHVRLSEAGRGYLPFAQRVLAELEQADRYAMETRQGHSVVRIATTPSIIGALLPPVLPQVQATWPELRIHPLDVATIEIASAVPSLKADLAIGVRLESDDFMEAQCFYRSSWCAFLSPRHRLGGQRRLAWAQLQGERLFMNKSSQLHLQLTLGEVAPLQDVYDVGTAISGMAMAAGGSGVAVFPGYVRPFARACGVATVPLVDPVLPHELQIAAPRRPATAAPLLAVRDMFVQAAAGLGRKGG